MCFRKYIRNKHTKSELMCDNKRNWWADILLKITHPSFSFCKRGNNWLWRSQSPVTSRTDLAYAKAAIEISGLRRFSSWRYRISCSFVLDTSRVRFSILFLLIMIEVYHGFSHSTEVNAPTLTFKKVLSLFFAFFQVLDSQSPKYWPCIHTQTHIYQL